MSGVDAAFLRCEAEWLQPPEQDEPLQVRISAWVSVYAEPGMSAEECVKAQIKSGDITIRDLDTIEVDEVEGTWPSDGPDPDAAYDARWE